MKRKCLLLGTLVVLLSTQIAHSGKFFDQYKEAMRSASFSGSVKVKKGEANKGISVENVSHKKADTLYWDILMKKVIDGHFRHHSGRSHKQPPSFLEKWFWGANRKVSELSYAPGKFHFHHEEKTGIILMRCSGEKPETEKRCKKIKKLTEEFLERDIGEWEDIPAH